MLCSIGIEYSIGVYNTEVEFSNGSCSPCSGFGKLLVSIAGPKGQALHVSYCSGIGNASNVSYCFATCGEKHVTFWNLSGSHKAMKIKEEKGSLGSANRNKTYLSIARLADNHMIAGTTDGDLMCFNAKRACTPLSSGGGHSGSVNTLWVNAKGTLLLSGGSDRMVIAWAIPTAPEASAGKGKADAPQLIPIKCSYFKLTDALMSSVCPSIPSNNESIKAKELSVRSICMSPDESKVIIGTQGCQVLECSTPASFTSNNGKEVTPSLSELRLIVAGHCRKELWGLDIRPPNTSNPSLSGADSEFCTVGDDCYLRVWSVQKKKMLRSIYLGAPSRYLNITALYNNQTHMYACD